MKQEKKGKKTNRRKHVHGYQIKFPPPKKKKNSAEKEKQQWGKAKFSVGFIKCFSPPPQPPFFHIFSLENRSVSDLFAIYK